MDGQYKTEISRDEYLKALALATMASGHYVKASECGAALNRIIMAQPEQYPGGHVDDAIYENEHMSVEKFDEALRKEGIKVSE